MEEYVWQTPFFQISNLCKGNVVVLRVISTIGPKPFLGLSPQKYADAAGVLAALTSSSSMLLENCRPDASYRFVAASTLNPPLHKTASWLGARAFCVWKLRRWARSKKQNSTSQRCRLLPENPLP